MIQWLETGDPGSCDTFMYSLPDQIHQMWSAHTPLADFQAVLTLFLDSHERANSLFLSFLIDD